MAVAMAGGNKLMNLLSGNHTYSLDEQEVGTWIDGSTIYEKTIYKAGTLVADTYNTIATFTDIEIPIAYGGFIKYNTDSTVLRALPHCITTETSVSADVVFQARSLLIKTGSLGNRFSDPYIWIQYIKKGIPLVPIMTSDTTPSGEVISSGYTGTGYPWKAFNGSNNGEYDGWNADGQNTFIGYHFPEAVVVGKVYFENRYFNSSDPNCRISSYQIQASNDGTNWTNLTPVITRSSDKNAMGASEMIAFENTTAYSYYRIYCFTSFDGRFMGAGIVQFYDVR